MPHFIWVSYALGVTMQRVKGAIWVFYLIHLCRMYSHPYQLDESVSNPRVVGGCFVLFKFKKKNFWKQTVENPIRRRVLRRLIWFWTDCRCPTKWTLGLYELTDEYNLYKYSNILVNQIFYQAFPNLEKQISK